MFHVYLRIHTYIHTYILHIPFFILFYALQVKLYCYYGVPTRVKQQYISVYCKLHTVQCTYDNLADVLPTVFF
jgi:hypothetical protein